MLPHKNKTGSTNIQLISEKDGPADAPELT